jgi:hypothetical protein
MKRSYFLIFALIIAVSVLPYPVMGADKGWSVAVKPGIYIPQSDLKDFDTGLNGEVAVAYRFHKNLAVEGGIGFFYTEDEFTQYGTVNGVPASMNRLDQRYLARRKVGILWSWWCRRVYGLW